MYVGMVAEAARIPSRPIPDAGLGENEDQSLEVRINCRRIFCSATGTRVFLRRVDLSSASAISALEISPAENFAIASCHMTESYFPS